MRDEKLQQKQDLKQLVLGTEQSINVRASYADEMVVHAIMMVQQLRVHRIACFYQPSSGPPETKDAKGEASAHW